jgi:hypothetical protein
MDDGFNTEIPSLVVPRLSVDILSYTALPYRLSGTRIAVTFDLPTPISENRRFRILCNSATSLGLREMVGVPQLTHISKNSGGSFYHYRLSLWRPMNLPTYAKAPRDEAIGRVNC